MAKPKISQQLQDKINYYKETGFVPIELPSSLTGIRMVSGHFDISRLDKSLSTVTINEYFGGAWQTAREILFSEKEDIILSYHITTSDGSLEIVEIQTEDITFKSYLFYFENETFNNKSMYCISMAGMISNELKEVTRTKKILDILDTPSWEELASQEVANVIKNKNDWYRLDGGWGLDDLWEKTQKTK